MPRLHPIHTLAPLALLGCAPAAAPADDAPLPGLWEVSAEAVAVDIRDRSPAEDAQTLRNLGGRSVTRECLANRPHKPGDRTSDGLCTYTRFDDAGPNASRTEVCEDKGDTVTTVETSGTRAPDSYDFRIITTRRARGTNEVVAMVETRETGRRLGPCPAAR